MTVWRQQHTVQEAKGGHGDKLILQVELPTLPHAVVHQQAATAPATPADMAASSDRGGPTLQLIPDPEVQTPKRSVCISKGA